MRDAQEVEVSVSGGGEDAQIFRFSFFFFCLECLVSQILQNLIFWDIFYTRRRDGTWIVTK